MDPFVDPFLSRTSKSLFRSLPCFLLSFAVYCCIIRSNLLRQNEVRECLLLFDAEFFVFQFAILKFKD